MSWPVGRHPTRYCPRESTAARTVPCGRWAACDSSESTGTIRRRSSAVGLQGGGGGRASGPGNRLRGIVNTGGPRSCCGDPDPGCGEGICGYHLLGDDRLLFASAECQLRKLRSAVEQVRGCWRYQQRLCVDHRHGQRGRNLDQLERSTRHFVTRHGVLCDSLGLLCGRRIWDRQVDGWRRHVDCPRFDV
jgi:hypothetical protein